MISDFGFSISELFYFFENVVRVINVEDVINVKRVVKILTFTTLTTTTTYFNLKTISIYYIL
jgi:hypothetical protein